jgi:hypothetical protein
MSFARTVLVVTTVVLSATGSAAAKPAGWPRLALEQAVSRAIERDPIVAGSQIELLRSAHGVADGVLRLASSSPWIF